MLDVARILHAGYLFKTSQAQILFDPIFENPFSRNCYAFPAVEFDLQKIQQLKPDAVFISHFHDDHCSFDSLKLINREIPIYMFCVHDEMFSLIRELGFKNVHSLKLDESIHVKDLEVIPRRALDADVDSLFQVKSHGLNVLNVVDSWIDEETFELLLKQAPFDLVMWPFQTMREVEVLSPKRYKPEPATVPEEWLNQLSLLKPKRLIPSSCQFRMEDWSWYNKAFFPMSYSQFNREVKAVIPDTEIIRLNPGCMISLGSNEASCLDWIKPIGDQNVDYEYNPSPQMTAAIAKNFPELTSEEKDRVVDYCNYGLVKIYKELGPPEDSYFIKTRHWQLSLFDHTGSERHFFYQLKEEQISLLTIKPDKVDWATEVSEFKLLAALENGESLTSMYLRIICEDEDVDILQDPLIRCLFSEGFAEYQKAQLKALDSPLRKK